MNPNTRTATPVTIVSGFLGAGKTSLLSHILSYEHGKKIAVLVNDFGKLNIDADSIVNISGQTISLSNGCICCTIRDDLLKEVMRLVELPITKRPDHIIIETSGVSDPTLVLHTFSLAALEGLVELYSILSVVDSEQLKNQLVPSNDSQYELVLRQIKVADIVIANKIDLLRPDELKDTVIAIKKIAPNARVLEAAHGVIPIEFVFDPTRIKPVRDDACTSNVKGFSKSDNCVPAMLGIPKTASSATANTQFESWVYSSENEFSLIAIRKIVENIPSAIYRTKGFLKIENQKDECAQLQMTGTRAWLKLGATWKNKQPRTDLVFIGKPGTFSNTSLTDFIEGYRLRFSPLSKSSEPITVNNLKALSIVYGV